MQICQPWQGSRVLFTIIGLNELNSGSHVTAQHGRNIFLTSAAVVALRSSTTTACSLMICNCCLANNGRFRALMWDRNDDVICHRCRNSIGLLGRFVRSSTACNREVTERKPGGGCGGGSSGGLGGRRGRARVAAPSQTAHCEPEGE